MKRSYLSLALAGMLFATACSQDQITGEIGGESIVTFTAELPSEVSSSRAYGEGTEATTLTYAIYEKDATNVDPLIIGEAEFEGLKAKFNVSLVNGMSYDVIFWADADESIYTYDQKAKTITADYDNVKSNKESYDAFYAYVPNMKVNGAAEQPVELFRPFAQLNIGTNDTDQAETAGLVVEATQVKVNAFNTLNLVNGEVSGETTITYVKSAKAEGKFPVTGNDYLAMNYILVPADYSTYDVTFSVYNTDATVTDEPINTRTYTAVPLQRNYKTNIYGRLLTSTTEFNVEIKPAFTNKHQVEAPVYYNADNNTYHVATAEGLLIAAEEIANNTDANITLEGDIDLNDLAGRSMTSNWTPIGTSETPYIGTFDGNGYTIKNLVLVENEAKEGKAYIGFFGYAKNSTIKNVTFENVYINIPCLDIDHSQGHIGAVAGSLEGTSTIENVTVKGVITVYATQGANGASRVAVVAGGNSYGDVTMKNVHVIANEGSSLIANNNTGALAGQLQGKMVFENCSSNIDVTVNKFFAGGLVGIAAGDSYFKNCHTTGNVAVVAGREGRHNDEYRVGGIAGGWADGKTKVCTLENCSYSGLISGTNADGSIASPLDYLGYVGRGYTLSNCEGSKVIIDGISFVQKYENQYGIYDVVDAEGNPVVAAASKEDLPKAENGQIITNFTEDVTLFGDITLSAKETTGNSGYGATGVKVNEGAVLDGNGNTLTVTNAGGTWDCVIAATGGTIKNLTVAGAMRGIFMPGATADVYIDNVTFKNVIYTFNSDSGNKNYGVYISNCTINGWTSHSDAHKEVVYTNCTFGEGSGYAFCRPYGPTSFVGCDFSEGYKIDARGKVTFENCTLNGIALTSENIATLVTSNIANVVEVK